MNKAITSLKELASVGSRAGLCLAAALSVHAAAAADWVPGERITLVSQSSPGTGNELMLRELADIWNKNNFVPKLAAVENVVGSQGEKMRRYMITQNRGNPHFIAAYTPSTLNSPLLMKSDTRWKQFTMVANLANDPAVLLVNAEGPYKSLKDLVAAAKDKPKQLLQGGGAYGSSASMAGKLLEEATGAAFSYTPFKGGGEAILQLLGKHIHFIIENPGEISQHVQAGKLKVVAVSERLQQFPEAPTYTEAGFKVKMLKQFRAIAAPPGIPPEALKFYLALLERTRQTPQWKEYLRKTSLVDSWMTGSELATFLEREELEYQRLNMEMGLVK